MKNTSKYIKTFFIILMSLVYIIVYYPTYSLKSFPDMLAGMIGGFMFPLIIAALFSKYLDKKADNEKRLLILLLYIVLLWC